MPMFIVPRAPCFSIPVVRELKPGTSSTVLYIAKRMPPGRACRSNPQDDPQQPSRQGWGGAHKLPRSHILRVAFGSPWRPLAAVHCPACSLPQRTSTRHPYFTSLRTWSSSRPGCLNIVTLRILPRVPRMQGQRKHITTSSSRRWERTQKGRRQQQQQQQQQQQSATPWHANPTTQPVSSMTSFTVLPEMLSGFRDFAEPKPTWPRLQTESSCSLRVHEFLPSESRMKRPTPAQSVASRP